MVQTLLQRLRRRWAKPQQDAIPSQPAPDTPASRPTPTVVLAGVRLVFGLEWSPVSNPGAIEADLQAARQAGHNYGALMPDHSLIGLARTLEPGRGKPYSGVLVMLDQLSSAEVEVFIFQIGERICFVGLVERRPVSGFDLLLPDLEAAKTTLVEFRAMHVGHDIRILTNLASTELPNSERVQLDGMVSHLDTALQVRRLINRPLRRIVGIALSVALLLAGGTGWLLYTQAEERRRQEEAARQAMESAPNYIYERAIGGLLNKAGQPGNVLLTQWREIVNSLPLVHEGWQLTQVSCQAIGCKVTWTRNYGNFGDFDQRTLPHSIASPELNPPTPGDLLKMELETRHSLSPTPVPKSSPPPPGLDREALPLVRNASLQWGSVLQDWSLLNVKAQLSSPVLLGPPGLNDPDPIKKPVVKFAWELTDGIWSLPAARLPQNAVPESLTITVKGQETSYQLTGSLYAKAKDF